MPVARIAFGADYNIPDEEADFFLSLLHPLKRGGIFVDGGLFRLDWLPGRNHSLFFGVQLPIGQRFVGKTRPRNDYLELPAAPPPAFAVAPPEAERAAVDRARALAAWTARLTAPFVAQWDSDEDEAMERFVADMGRIAAFLDGDSLGFSGPIVPEDVVRAYHAEMERAFSFAVSDAAEIGSGSTDLGVRVWNEAREVILAEVILPYNRQLGRKKKHDSTFGYGARASAAFYEWLSTGTPVPESRLRDVAGVFAEVLRIVDDVRAATGERWDDNRFTFLPLQLALRPEEHDEQLEIDALIERAVEETFQPANRIYYVENEQFQVEVRRMILEARDYHVLWIHDVKGVTGAGNPDRVAYAQTVDSYLRALTNAVNAYDETGRIPQPDSRKLSTISKSSSARDIPRTRAITTRSTQR